MAVKLNLFANLREVVGEKEVYRDLGESKLLKDLLMDFAAFYGKEARELLFNPKGNVWESIIILVNGEPVDVKGFVELSDGDELFILLPTAGG